MASRVFLANVGANTSHPYSSPLFDDGTFELLPIPESPRAAGPHSITFGDLRSWRNPRHQLKTWIPERFWQVAAHADPDFRGRTYGDNCERAPRAHALKALAPGDLLMFIARLERPSPDSPRSGFYLVGYLQVDEILARVSRSPDRLSERFENNAHVRKGRNDDLHWDGFWVFGGSERSRRLRHAVPFDRKLAERVLTDASGQPLRWDSGRSELQVIGSYTRTCRCIIDPATSEHAGHRLAALWQRIQEFNPGETEWPLQGEKY